MSSTDGRLIRWKMNRALKKFCSVVCVGAYLRYDNVWLRELLKNRGSISDWPVVLRAVPWYSNDGSVDLVWSCQRCCTYLWEANQKSISIDVRASSKVCWRNCLFSKHWSTQTLRSLTRLESYLGTPNTWLALWIELSKRHKEFRRKPMEELIFLKAVSVTNKLYSEFVVIAYKNISNPDSFRQRISDLS